VTLAARRRSLRDGEYAWEKRMNNEILLGAYIFILAIFLGLELINRVPATLHTPLMSATNAIHGIVLLGAMIVVGSVDSWWLELIGFIAVVLGAANVVGGFAVTDRMLEMFKKRPTPTTTKPTGSSQGQGQ
jgi:NAD(P) transhydrogenase subunit alpha